MASIPKQNHTRTNGSLQGLATMICGLRLSYPFPFQLDPWPWIPKTRPKFHRIPTRGRYPSEVDDSPQLNCYQTHFMNHSGPCDPDCFCDPPASRAKQPGCLQKARLPQGSCPDDCYQTPILAIS